LRGRSRFVLAKAAVVCLLLGVGIVGCRSRPPEHCAVENHSYAHSDVVVTHLDLDIVVDFDKQRISGSVGLAIAHQSPSRKLYLDTQDLDIEKVTLDDGEKTSFVLGAEDSVLGRPLIVDITPETRIVRVYYRTGSGARGLDWLSPEQTAAGKAPFLYTQGQAILNRSWIPCQDNPGVRVTYDARVQVPPGMLALMSAENPTEKSADGVYQFTMRQPIPTYLVALAVGDIEFRPISERCGVYAEPGVVEKAAWEFADAEHMIEAAESLYGAYRWDRYDVLVLPPSFPYGGMENPRLTFVTPVIIAGDRSLVSTVAHELAHSWSGNLVTNATWDDFWLNEGVTVYIERRILEALYGKPYAEMQALLGMTDLEQEIERLGADSPDTRLHLDTKGRDLDSGLPVVAYEKGYLFLRWIDETVGRERWDAFLRRYFNTFAFQTMTADHFVRYLRDELVRGDAGLEKKLAIDEWVYGTGLPAERPVIHSDAFDHIHARAKAFEAGLPASELDADAWTTPEWKEFLQQLTVDPDQMAELDARFDLTHRANSEVRMVWFDLAIKTGYEAAYPELERYLVSIGRIWPVSTLYQRLAETPKGLELARQIYARARPRYHPITRKIVDRILSTQP
jgi:leukotriene-A4 hydrolase